jgi:hypothetical protein
MKRLRCPCCGMLSNQNVVDVRSNAHGASIRATITSRRTSRAGRQNERRECGLGPVAARRQGDEEGFEALLSEAPLEEIIATLADFAADVYEQAGQMYHHLVHLGADPEEEVFCEHCPGDSTLKFFQDRAAETAGD